MFVNNVLPTTVSFQKNIFKKSQEQTGIKSCLPNDTCTISFKGVKEATELHKLLEQGSNDIKQIKDLAKEPSNLSYSDRNGQCALDKASTPEQMIILLVAGADPNDRDPWGHTPMFYAKFPEAVRLLKLKGAKILVSDNNGSSPLHSVKDVKVAQALLDEGVKELAESKGITNITEEVERDLKYKLANRPNSWGFTPLHDSANAQVAQFWIDNGAQVNYGGGRYDDETPLNQQIKKLSNKDDENFLAKFSRIAPIITVIAKAGGHL